MESGAEQTTHYHIAADEILNIPETATQLTFAAGFNQSITGCIPSTVTHLTFGTPKNDVIEENEIV